MKKWIVCVALVAPALLTAQQTAPAPVPAAPQDISMAYAVKAQYESIRDEITKLADKMPAELYAFQPTPDVKTFAGSLAHIATANIAQCGMMLGRKHELAGQDLSKTMTTKEPLVQALKSGFAFCDEYFNTLTGNAPLTTQHYNSAMMKDGKRVPISVEMGASATALLAHNNEMYGYMSVYLRLKGIVPPTSEKK